MKISLVNISSARHANIKYSPIKLHPEVKQKQQPKHWEQKEKQFKGKKVVLRHRPKSTDQPPLLLLAFLFIGHLKIDLQILVKSPKSLK